MKGTRLLTYFIAAILAVATLGFSNHTLAAVSGHKLTKTEIKKMIVEEANRQGLSPHLALSVARQESLFNTNAVSPVGAIGLFQLMPATARDLKVNPRNVRQNIKGGIKYLKLLKGQFGSTKLALAAYNAGPGAVQKYGGIPPYRETQTYVRNIMRFYANYQKNPDPIVATVSKK